MTMNTLATIIAEVQDVIGIVTGIRTAPDIPPEQIAGGGVVALVYPATGRFSEIAPGQEEGLHTLHLMLATPYANMRTDWARIIGLGDTVPRALLAAGTMTATIIQINELRYTFGNLEWGGQPMFGWMFEIDILLTGSVS